MKWIISILICLSLCGFRAIAVSTNWLSDGNMTTLQTGINGASAFDTLEVTNAVIYHWITNFYCTNSIHLVFTNCTMYDDAPVGASPRVGKFLMSTNSVLWVSGLKLIGGTNAPSQSSFDQIIVDGICHAIKFDNCNFWTNGCTALYFGRGDIWGVVDDCTLNNNSQGDQILTYQGGLFGDPDQEGDRSWANPIQWGTTNGFIYIEHCNLYFDDGLHSGYANDALCGSRSCWRYNNLTNMVIQVHGNDGGQRQRSALAMEVYSNNIVNNGDNTLVSLVQFRGGTGRYWGNYINIPFGNDPWTIYSFRSTYSYPPWGGANGQNPWDTNNASAIVTSTHNGPNNVAYLQDTTKTWTINQFVGFTIQNVTAGGANVQSRETFSVVLSNSVNIIYFAGDAATGGSMRFTNGNTYSVFGVTNKLDKIGNGIGDLITNSPQGNINQPVDSLTGTTNWPNQVNDPIYWWSNNVVINGTTHVNFNIFNTYDGTVADPPSTIVTDIQVPRDLTNGVYSYTPLVYPYPWPYAALFGPGSVTTNCVFTSNLNPSVNGESIGFNNIFQTNGVTATDNNGTASLYDGATLVSSHSTSSGITIWSVSSLSSGIHNMTVVQNASGNYLSTTSSILVQVVAPYTTVSTLSSSLNPSVSGNAITITDTLTTNGMAALPATGTVTFKDGGTPVSTNAVSNGTATWTISSLTVGTHSLTAFYNGDAYYTSRLNSNPLSQAVNGASGPIGGAVFLSK